MLATTAALLQRAGVSSASRVLDIGCGGGDVTHLMAELAPGAHVAGVDRDPVVIDLARSEAADAGVGNIEFRVDDVTELVVEEASFDVVYARFLLSHLPDPVAMIERMIGWCRPGGAIVVEDVDVAGSICWPEDPCFARSVELYQQANRACGGDPQIGLRLPAMLRGAGAVEIEATIVQPGGLAGDATRIQLLTLVNIAPAAIELGLTTAHEIDGLRERLEVLVERDDTFITAARVVQTSARRVGLTGSERR